MPKMTIEIQLSEDAEFRFPPFRFLRVDQKALDRLRESSHRYARVVLTPKPSVGAANTTTTTKDPLAECVDCQVFAREFNRRYPGVDEGLVLGWFATAIENGKDFGRREAAEKSKHADCASDADGYRTSTPTNSDGKTSSPPGGPPLTIKLGLFPGDCVLHLPSGNATAIHRVYDDGRATAFAAGVKIDDWSIKFQKIPRETYDILLGKQRAAQELREAIGFLSTLSPKIVMDPDHPMKMAREIERKVREAFEKCDESARTIDRMKASHNEELKKINAEIRAEIPEEFCGPHNLKQSVRLLAGAFNGLATLLKINPAKTDGTSFVPSPGPT